MKNNIFKSLVLTALMCLSSLGMWGEDVVVTHVDIDFSDTIVVNDNEPKYSISGNMGKMVWNEQWTVTPYINDGKLRFGNFTGSVYIDSDFKNSTGVITVSFDLAFGKLNKDRGVGFKLLDSNNEIVIDQFFDAYNGDFNDKNPLGLDWSSMYRGSNTVLQDRCVYFTIIFDYNTNKITTRTKCYLSGTGRNPTNAEYIVDMPSENYISTFQLYGNIYNGDRYSVFDNLKVTSISKPASYVVNYQTLDGIILKKDTVDSYATHPVVITDEQKAPFFIGDDKTSKYYYSSDDSEGMTVAEDGSTVVTIKVRESELATTIHDFEDENKLFVIHDKDRIGTSILFSDTLSTNVSENSTKILRFNSGNENGVAFAYYNFSDLVKTAKIINVSFDFYMNSVSGQRYFTIGDAGLHNAENGGFTPKSQWGYGNNGSIFYFGCSRGKVNGKNEDYFSINTTRKASSNQEIKASEVFGNWMHMDVIINIEQKKVSYTMTDADDNILFSEENIEYASDAANACNQIDFYTSRAGESFIDNITISTESPYLVHQLNLQAEDNNVLKSEVRKVLLGQPITGIPLVVEKNATYYTLDDDRLDDFSYGKNQLLSDEIIDIKYQYSPDVVFFSEGESTTGIDLRYSNGGVGTVAGQNKRDRGISVGTLPDGIYEFIVNISKEETNGRALVIRQSKNDPLASVAYLKSDKVTGIKKDYFALTEETSSLFINGANSGTEKTNLSVSFDYVMIKRISDYAESVTVTLTSAGVGTLCSPYNLDFSGAVNVAAYKAQTVEGMIKLTKVQTVAAGEGVLIRSLNGGAVTEDIPVAAMAYEPNEGNEFIGTLVDIVSQPSEDEDYKYYILSSKTVNGNKVYGFYLANNKKIGAGKAYLRVPLAAAAKYSFFSFDDETTGIEDVELGITETDSPVYDLFGRKVVNPATGLYIKNGKKFIVK